MILENKKILLGITGGIAAYKSCLLLRLLQQEGAEVRVVMTPSATKFVGEETFAALTEAPVYTHIFAEQEGHPSDYFQHINTAKWADLFVVAPCSANTIANLAHGQANDALSLSFISTACPKIIVPAMNPTMFSNPIVQSNLQSLESFGVDVLNPASGIVACGDEGVGKLPEPEDILDYIVEKLYSSNKSGKKVLITAGRTEEAIDSVRYISNKSSGKTALEVAKEFFIQGYDVHVVHGPINVEIPPYIKSTSVRSADEMYEEVNKAEDIDVYIMAAAVADFKAKNISTTKIKASREVNSIELSPNPDILKEISAFKKESQLVIGFALETENYLENARIKIQSKGCDALLLNAPIKENSGIGHDDVEFCLIEQNNLDNPPELKLGSKKALAQSILLFVEQSL